MQANKPNNIKVGDIYKEFLKPVYIDDKIMVRVEVIEQNEETNRLTLETICRNLGGKKCTT